MGKLQTASETRNVHLKTSFPAIPSHWAISEWFPVEHQLTAVPTQHSQAQLKGTWALSDSGLAKSGLSQQMLSPPTQYRQQHLL